MSHTSLIEKFETAVRETGAELQALPWENPQAYGAWIAQEYHLVKHTTRFICLAAGNVELGNREGHYDWVGHLKGELNHDLVALNDLRALGATPDTYPEMIETQLIQQSQYYFLDRGRPLALSGYALLLEGLAAKIGPLLLERTEKAHGKNATAFLRLHAKVDVDHYAEGLEGLSHMAPEDLRETEKNLAQSQLLYTNMSKSITQKYGRAPVAMKKAA